MLAKRIIPCLDVVGSRTVKGVKFKNLRDAGDPLELAWKYSQAGADELVFLDIKASQESRSARFEFIKQVARNVSIPLTVGGGINSLSDVSDMLKAGADKISINTAAVNTPRLITQIAEEFGTQCVVVAIDSRRALERDLVCIYGGSQITELETVSWARQVVELGAGEILLTCLDTDGLQAGFNLELNKSVSQAVSVPLIASGGAGKERHFKDVFTLTAVDAALAASVFHFGQISIPELKQYLQANSIEVRL